MTEILTTLAEIISSGKYPAYAQYKKETRRYL